MSTAVSNPRTRPDWRTVAMPNEHGGWGLTAEPVVLGLLVAPSWAGLALAVGAVVAFLARTPLRLVLVDRCRHRWLPRSSLAARIASAELLTLAIIGLTAAALAGWAWAVPAAVALPLVGVEVWFDMRSRGRRLLPELCGAVGMAAAATSIALAGGAARQLAIALWVVLAARAIVAIPFVRTQIQRLRHGSVPLLTTDSAQAVGIAVALVAVALTPRVLAGAIAVSALAAAQLAWLRRPAVPAKTLGLRQLALGLAIVAITAAGVLTT